MRNLNQLMENNTIHLCSFGSCTNTQKESDIVDQTIVKEQLICIGLSEHMFGWFNNWLISLDKNKFN